MPVTRGLLRPGGDGSMKSFVIILTVVGLMFLVYYKYKLTSYTSTSEVAVANESVYVENKMAKEVAKEIASLKEQLNRWKDEYETCKTEKEVLEIRQKEAVKKKNMEGEMDNMRKKLLDTNDELKIQKEKVENLSKRLEECTDISKLFKGNSDVQDENCKSKVIELNRYCSAEMSAFVKKTMPDNNVKPPMVKDENSLVGNNNKQPEGGGAFIESDDKNQLKGKLRDESILLSDGSDKKSNQQRTMTKDKKYLPKILHYSNVADVNKNAKQADSSKAVGKDDLNGADANKMVIKMPAFNNLVDTPGEKLKSPVGNVSNKVDSALKKKDNEDKFRDNNNDNDGGDVKNDNKNGGGELNKNKNGKEVKNNDDSNFNDNGSDKENTEYDKDDENEDDNATNETNAADSKIPKAVDKYPIEKASKTAKDKAEDENNKRNDFFSKKFDKRSGSQTVGQQQQRKEQSTQSPQQSQILPLSIQQQQQLLQQQQLPQQQRQGDLQPKQQRPNSSQPPEKQQNSQQQQQQQPPPPPPSNVSTQHKQLDQQSKKLQNDSLISFTSSGSKPTKSNNFVESKEKLLESKREKLSGILDGKQNDNQKTLDSNTVKLDKLEDNLEDVIDDDEDVPKMENSIKDNNQNVNVVKRNNYINNKGNNLNNGNKYEGANNDILFQKRNKF